MRPRQNAQNGHVSSPQAERPYTLFVRLLHHECHYFDGDQAMDRADINAHRRKYVAGGSLNIDPQQQANERNHSVLLCDWNGA